MSVRKCSTHVPIIAIIITTRPNFIIVQLFIDIKMSPEKVFIRGDLLSLSLSLFLSSCWLLYVWGINLIVHSLHRLRPDRFFSVKRENEEEEGHSRVVQFTFKFFLNKFFNLFCTFKFIWCLTEAFLRIFHDFSIINGRKFKQDWMDASWKMSEWLLDRNNWTKIDQASKQSI